jgi:hypothetical protein
MTTNPSVTTTPSAVWELSGDKSASGMEAVLYQLQGAEGSDQVGSSRGSNRVCWAGWVSS